MESDTLGSDGFSLARERSLVRLDISKPRIMGQPVALRLSLTYSSIHELNKLNKAKEKRCGPTKSKSSKC